MSWFAAGAAAVSVVGGMVQGSAQKKQAKRNAEIEKRNRETNLRIAKRDQAILEKEIPLLQAETKTSVSLLRQQFGFKETDARRDIAGGVGKAKTHRINKDVIRGMILQGERQIRIGRIGLENQARDVEYKGAKRVYDTKLNIQNIGIRAESGAQASQARESQLTSQANDNSYLFGVASSAIGGIGGAVDGGAFSKTASSSSGAFSSTGGIPMDDPFARTINNFNSGKQPTFSMDY